MAKSNVQLQKEANDFFTQARNYLIQSLSVGNANYSHSGISPSASLNRGYGQQSPMGLNLPFGRMPSDADVKKFIAMQGGNPAMKKLIARGKSRSASKGQAQGPTGPVAHSTPTPGIVAGQDKNATPQTLVDKLFADAMAKENEANDANEYRYAQTLQELNDLRGRRGERAANWGYAAQADIDERMQENLKGTQAQLSARGLGNTNVMGSFRNRTARDTAREQQRVSEMRDARMNDYDAQDTQNITGVIERRNDLGPDTTGLLQLAMQYGMSGAGQRLNGGAEGAPVSQPSAAPTSSTANRSKLRMMQPPGTGGPIGGAMPLFLNGDPLAFANNYLAAQMNPVRWGRVESNAYPVNRHYNPRPDRPRPRIGS